MRRLDRIFAGVRKTIKKLEDLRDDYVEEITKNKCKITDLENENVNLENDVEIARKAANNFKNLIGD